jgi:hypothetical protein
MCPDGTQIAIPWRQLPGPAPRARYLGSTWFRGGHEYVAAGNDINSGSDFSEDFGLVALF